jgi:hypothetical protein
MADWVLCTGCGLRHAARPDGACPRCHQPVAIGVATEAPSASFVGAPLAAAAPMVAARMAGDHCQLCGAIGPVGEISFRQNIGLLVMRLNQQVAGRVCPSCASGKFWQLSLITLVAGWWGVISFVVTPIFLINNAISYARYQPTGETSRPGLVPALALASVVVAVGGFLIYALLN